MPPFLTSLRGGFFRSRAWCSWVRAIPPSVVLTRRIYSSFHLPFDGQGKPEISDSSRRQVADALTKHLRMLFEKLDDGVSGGVERNADSSCIDSSEFLYTLRTAHHLTHRTGLWTRKRQAFDAVTSSLQANSPTRFLVPFFFALPIPQRSQTWQEMHSCAPLLLVFLLKGEEEKQFKHPPLCVFT